MIAILLSTYNGERYLSEQLDSLLNQTHSDLKLCIRDDGSTDETPKILKDYANTHENIQILNDDLGNIGVAQSYRLLMQSSNADFYLFADQDDIWELNKLKILLEIAMKTSSTSEPYLLFSNMIIFDEESGEKYDFFEKFRISKDAIKKGLFQGAVSGCLMLFNERAKQMSLATNSASNMLHDWDLLMTCYLFGQVELINQRLIHHRLHDKNAIGQNLNKSKLILLKDLGKYFFKSSAYRKIELKYYFDYVRACSENIDKQIRLTKELFTENELNELSFFKRKKWYLKHFNPFIYGKVRGLLIVLTV